MAMGECSAYSRLKGQVCSLAYELAATWARMHEPGVSATPGLKSSYAGLACKVGMHDTVVTLLLA